MLVVIPGYISRETCIKGDQNNRLCLDDNKGIITQMCDNKSLELYPRAKPESFALTKEIEDLDFNNIEEKYNKKKEWIDLNCNNSNDHKRVVKEFIKTKALEQLYSAKCFSAFTTKTTTESTTRDEFDPFQIGKSITEHKNNSILETTCSAIHDAINEKPKFKIETFATSRVPYLSFIHALCLTAILLFVKQCTIYNRPYDPENDERSNFWDLSSCKDNYGYMCIYFISLAAIELTPHLLRIFISPTFEKGRVGFTYHSLDIDPISFALDVAYLISITLILLILWRGCVNWHQEWEDHFEKKHKFDYATCFSDIIEKAHLKINTISNLYDDWFINSILLAAAFLPWTYFHFSYPNFTNDGEKRYLFSILADHIIWIIMWILISKPLILAIKDWKRFKCDVLSSLISYPSSEKHINNFEKIVALQPFNDSKQLIAGIMAAVSFLLPIINLIKG